MSKDIKAGKICDHTLIEDIVFLEDDRRTLKIKNIVAVQSSVILKRDGFEIDKENLEFGWDLISLPNNSLKELRFRKPSKSIDDFFELTYITNSLTCPKCEGTDFVFDLVANEIGLLVEIKNEEKLMQDIVKGTFTIRGSNPFHLWYGTQLNALAGSKLVNFNTLRVAAAQDISEFFDNFKDIQSQQVLIPSQKVSDKERLESLVSINIIQPDDTEPSLVEISIIFRNRAGDLKEIKRILDTGKNKIFGTIQDTLNRLQTITNR